MGFLTLLLPITSLASLVGFFWLVRNAFRTSTGWGLAVLFLSPFSAIFYAIRNWEDSKKPFLVYSGSTAAGVLVMVLMFGAMGGFQAVSLAGNIATGEMTEEQAAEFITGQMDRIEKAGGLDSQGQASLDHMRGVMDQMTEGADGSMDDETESDFDTDGEESADPRSRISEPASDRSDQAVAEALRTRAQETVRKRNLPVGPIRVQDAGRYIGAKMTAVGSDGIKHTGKLASADGNALWFDKYFSGGTFSLELKKSQIRSLEILDN